MSETIIRLTLNQGDTCYATILPKEGVTTYDCLAVEVPGAHLYFKVDSRETAAAFAQLLLDASRAGDGIWRELKAPIVADKTAGA